MRPLSFIAFLFISFLSAIPASAQTASDVNEDSRLTKDATTGVYELAWWGKVERTYFIQQSDDLVTWTYMPVIEWKASAGVTAWNFANVSGAQKSFFRLRFSDAATGGNPETADFDGDHVGNMTELNQITDPLGWTDVDGDQMPGDWEIFHGFNPTSAADATIDADDDGLTNRAEFNHDSNPHLKDTDGDTFEDGYEVTCGTDPALATSSPLIDAQAQLVQVNSLAQAYLSVRASNGSLEDRLAAWNAFQTAKQALQADLANLSENTDSPTTQEEIGEVQEGLGDAAAPVESTPSTAHLEYKWVEATYGGTHWVSEESRWIWSEANESWSYDGPVGTTEGDMDNSGTWGTSDGYGGTISTLAEAMNVTANPEQWLDAGEDKLTAAGSYLTITTGGEENPPTVPGMTDGQTTTTAKISYTVHIYSSQYREVRLKRSEDGDANVPLWMTFLLSDDDPSGAAAVDNYGYKLSMSAGSNESSGTLAFVGRTIIPNTTRTPAGPKIDIVPDSTMYDSSGVGIMGDKVPSASSNSTQHHFVTPQQTSEISAPYVIFQATGYSAADFEIVPPATEPRVVWIGGSVVTGDKTKRRVSRSAAGHTILTLKPKNGASEVMNAWVVWATITSTSIPFGETQLSGGGLNLSGGFKFEHAIQPSGIVTGTEIPNLKGQHDVIPPGGSNSCGASALRGADHKWDNSRQIRGKLINPNNFTVNCLDQLSDTYPVDPTEGNDDVSQTLETDDPYSPATSATLKGQDTVGRSWSGTTGQNGNTVEHRLQFQEFTRLDIVKKWYRISDMYPWRVHLKFKKVNGAWINNLSSKATDNAEF